MEITAQKCLMQHVRIQEAIMEEVRIVLEMAELTNVYDFDQDFSFLFAWYQSVFVRIERLGGK